MDEIVVKVPAQHKGLAEAMKQTVAAVVKFERQAVKQRGVDYREHERQLAERAARIEREAHAVSLRALDLDAERVRINGEEHRRVGRHCAQFRTRVGPVAVERTLYRKLGERNARTVNLVTLRSGAVLDEWLPDTAAAMAHRIAVGTSREAAAASQVEHTLPYSRSSFERVGHEVGRLCVDKRVEIEEALASELAVPKGAASVSVSVDRVAVPMEEARPRPLGRPKKKAPKRPIAVVYRMAYCATLTIHDANGEALHTIRYGRMPKGDADALVEAVASDALMLRKKRRSLRVVALGDGAHEIWNLLERHVDEPTFGEVFRLVDFWHLVEKLAPAAKVIADDHDGAKRLLARWRASLANRKTAADMILAELRDSDRGQARRRRRQPAGPRGDDLPAEPSRADELRQRATAWLADRQRQRRGVLQEPVRPQAQASGCAVARRNRRAGRHAARASTEQSLACGRARPRAQRPRVPPRRVISVRATPDITAVRSSRQSSISCWRQRQVSKGVHVHRGDEASSPIQTTPLPFEWEAKSCRELSLHRGGGAVVRAKLRATRPDRRAPGNRLRNKADRGRRRMWRAFARPPPRFLL